MKHSTLLSTALLGLVLATTGCATFHKSTAAAHIRTYALVVSVNNGQPPTDAQWAELQKKFATMLGARGYALVSDPALADNIIHVRFSPDADDPTTGTAYVVSVKTNTLAFNTSLASSAAPAGFGYSMNSPFGLSDYSDTNSYYTPEHVVYHPGAPHHPTNPADGPPGTTPPTKDHPPINFVGNYPTHIAPPPGFDHGSPPNHSRPEPTYSNSDSSYSRSDSSYRSSSSYDGPSTSYSSSASYSAPTMSAPSSWSSSSSSSASSAPSSSPPAESTSSRAQPN